MGNYLAYLSPALPSTTVTGTTTVSFPAGMDSCQGPPVYGGITQSPYFGPAALDPAKTIPYPMVPMFAETFGGGIYHLCDGNAVIGIGAQLPGYPGWDTNTSLTTFNLDLSQFLGKTTSMSMPVAGNFQATSDDPNSGTVSYTGTFTFSTAGLCDPIARTCPTTSLRLRKPGR